MDPSIRQVTLGLLGLGTVGRGLVEMVRRNSDLIAFKTGLELRIKRALVRDPSRARPLPADRVTTRPEDVLDDPEIEIVVEVVGGIEPARTWILRAIERGKHVVTANKALLAEHGDEIFLAARQRGVQVGFEASVCGGVPVLRSLSAGLIANRIELVCGILNGTSNTILTRMEEKGESYAEALAYAQQKGLAEADPSLDVKGIDSAHKLAILARLAFQARVSPGDIPTEGIAELRPEDIADAREFGYVIRLLAVGRRESGAATPERGSERSDRLYLRVHPAWVPRGHPLADVRSEFNAVLVRGDATGEMMFIGKGAGAEPTASAVLSDAIEIGRASAPALQWNLDRVDTLAAMEGESRFYLRFPIYDRPGVIGLIATALGNHNVSITHAGAALTPNLPGRGNVRIVTHLVRESVLRRALTEIQRLPVLVGKPVSIHIFE